MSGVGPLTSLKTPAWAPSIRQVGRSPRWHAGPAGCTQVGKRPASAELPLVCWQNRGVTPPPGFLTHWSVCSALFCHKRPPSRSSRALELCLVVPEMPRPAAVRLRVAQTCRNQPSRSHEEMDQHHVLPRPRPDASACEGPLPGSRRSAVPGGLSGSAHRKGHFHAVDRPTLSDKVCRDSQPDTGQDSQGTCPLNVTLDLRANTQCNFFG